MDDWRDAIWGVQPDPDEQLSGLPESIVTPAPDDGAVFPPEDWYLDSAPPASAAPDPAEDQAAQAPQPPADAGGAPLYPYEEPDGYAPDDFEQVQDAQGPFGAPDLGGAQLDRPMLYEMEPEPAPDSAWEDALARRDAAIATGEPVADAQRAAAEEAAGKSPLDRIIDADETLAPYEEWDPAKLEIKRFVENQKKQLKLAEEAEKIAQAKANRDLEAENRYRAEKMRIEQMRQEHRRAVEELANDPDWWESRSTGQRIASIIGAAMGGLVAPYQGGRNPALEIIDNAIAEHRKEREMRRRDLAARGEQLQQETAQAFRDMEEEQLLSAAWAKGAENRLLQQAAQLDPRGTMKMGALSLAQQMRARAEESFAKAEEMARKADLEEREQRRKEQDSEIDRALKLSKLRPSGGSGGVVPSAQNKRDALKRYGYKPEDEPRLYFVGGYDEPPIEFATAGAREDFIKRRTDTQSAVRIIDQVLAAQKKYGWEHPIWNSNQGRQMRAKYVALMMKMKNAWQLGALSGDDIKLVDDGLGGDPSKMRKTAASLRAQRQVLTEDFQTELANRKYPGAKRFSFPALGSDEDVTYVSDEEVGGGISTRERPGLPDAAVGDRLEYVGTLAERYGPSGEDDPAKGAEVLASEISKIEADTAQLRKRLKSAKESDKAAIQKAIDDNAQVVSAMAKQQGAFAARAAKLKGRSAEEKAAKESRVPRASFSAGQDAIQGVTEAVEE